MVNWAPVYSPQQRNTEGKEGWRGAATSGNHQPKRALDPEIPVSDPSPPLTSPTCLYSTPTPPPFLSICLPPSLLSFFSPPLVLAAHHFHVSSAMGLIQTDCLTVSKTYSLSQPPLLPSLCPVFISGNRHSFMVKEVPVSVWTELAGRNELARYHNLIPDPGTLDNIHTSLLPPPANPHWAYTGLTSACHLWTLCVVKTYCLGHIVSSCHPFSQGSAGPRKAFGAEPQ